MTVPTPSEGEQCVLVGPGYGDLEIVELPVWLSDLVGGGGLSWTATAEWLSFEPVWRLTKPALTADPYEVERVGDTPPEPGPHSDLWADLIQRAEPTDPDVGNLGALAGVRGCRGGNPVTAPDDLLRWASEAGGGSWRHLRDAAAYLARIHELDLRPWQLAVPLASLGHLDIDWEEQRWSVAPPAVVLSPGMGLCAYLVGARPSRMLERFAAATEDQDVYPFELTQRNAPRCGVREVLFRPSGGRRSRSPRSAPDI